jgi:hypothetical protein
MAVGDTVRVTPVGATLTGAPVTSYDSVLYVLNDVTDSLRISVSATGLVTALTPSDDNTPVLLDVVAFKDGLAAADQAILKITPTKFSGATLSIQPVAPDSATLAGGSDKFIVPLIQNAGTGELVNNPKIRFDFTKTECQYVMCYQPIFPSVGTFTGDQLSLNDNGNYRGVQLNDLVPLGKQGTVWVRANVLVYGVMLHDSVQYTLTYPLNNEIDFQPLGLTSTNRARGNVYIAPGGNVVFYNAFSSALGASIIVTFDDSTAALAMEPPSTIGGASGNITALRSDEYTQRLFVTPGAYNWTATVIGSVPPYTGSTIKGVIHVQ